MPGVLRERVAGLAFPVDAAAQRELVPVARQPVAGAQLNINNLFDKTYYDFAGNQIYYGTPRNGMVSLNYKF